MVLDCQKFTCFIILSAALGGAGIMNGPQVSYTNIEVTGPLNQENMLILGHVICVACMFAYVNQQNS
jgi:hypothetical protein